MKTNHRNIQRYSRAISLISVRTERIFIVASCFLLSVFCLESCKKFIDIPPPKSELVTVSVFNNNASATSAQVAIYAKMWDASESYNLAVNMGLYADELNNYATDRDQKQVYSNGLEAINSFGWGALYGYSTNYYAYIYDANAVINGLQTTAGCSAAVKQQLTGEAYFIRAFWHFYLSDLYGPVPLVLTTNYTINATIARTSRVGVLQQVIADLKIAQSLLNSNYVDGSDTVTTTERVRPTKAAAEALLARAYLYLGDYNSHNATDYQKADSMATAVIGNGIYSLSLLGGVFLKNSSEAIWQLQTPSPAGWDTPDGQNFILLAAPSSSGHSDNSTTISSQLMNSFEPNDQRKTIWIGSVMEGTNTYYFPYKYKVSNELENQEYEMVLRLGEQYLIRAEAKVHEDNIPGALSDLNMIRNRAGLPNYTGAQDAASVLIAILHERQVELFTEWGARWFDLCRAYNAGLRVNATTVLGPPGNQCQAKGGTWNSNNYQLLWPIPQNDISADPNLTQNPGY